MLAGSNKSQRPVSAFRLLSLQLLESADPPPKVLPVNSNLESGGNKYGASEAEESGSTNKIPPEDPADDPLMESRKPKQQLDWNQEKYLNTCARLGITPSQKFLHSLLLPRVQLSRLFLGPEGAFACSLALGNNAHLRELILEDNELGCSGAQQLTGVIKDNPFLTELRLTNNRIGLAGLNSIAGALICNRTVKLLDLSGNRLEENCAGLVRRLLEENETLTELYLAHNNFRENGIVQIAHGLAHNATLKVLDLSWNHIRLNGAISLCDSLRHNQCLEAVLLGWNGLHSEGCRSLARSLPANGSLAVLDISCNRIDAKCLEFLVKGLRGNSSLKCLRISQNPLTAENIRVLLTKIEDLQLHIEELDVTGLTVDPHSVTIAERIAAGRSFKIVFGVLLKQQAKAEEDDLFMNDDPMMVLMEFMKLKNMRLLDLFLNLDSDGSKSLTHKEFKDGLVALGVPMSPVCMQRLLRALDKDGDGEVDYSELVAGQREHRRRMMRVQVQERSVPYEETELGVINAKLRRLLANRERAARDARHALEQQQQQQQQAQQTLASGAIGRQAPRMLSVAMRVLSTDGQGRLGRRDGGTPDARH